MDDTKYIQMTEWHVCKYITSQSHLTRSAEILEYLTKNQTLFKTPNIRGITVEVSDSNLGSRVTFCLNAPSSTFSYNKNALERGNPESY